MSKRGISLSGLERLNLELGEAVSSARAQGSSPASDDTRALVERYLTGLAAPAGRAADDPEFRRGVRARFDRQDPRATRYWQLVGILNAEHPMARHMSARGFLIEALEHRVLATA